MTMLLAPAVALMRSFSYPKKFALIGLLSAIAVGFPLASMTVSLMGSIKQGQRELDGVAVIKPVLHVVQALQQHRMLSAEALTNIEGAKNRIADVEKDVAAAFGEADLVMPNHGAALEVDQDWEGIKQEWNSLATEWSELTVSANLAAHDDLIERALKINNKVHDASGLVVDPALDSYYLANTAFITLPDFAERLGKISAAGMSVLARRMITDDQRFAFTRDLGSLNTLGADLLAGLERSAQYNAEIKPKLDEFVQKFTARISTLTHVIEYEIASGRLDSTPAQFTAQAAEAIDSGYAELGNTLLPTVDKLIGDRIARQRLLLAVNLGIAVLLLLGFGYLSIGFYRAIVSDVRNLSNSARRIAEGDLTARVPLAAKDELAQVGAGFNTMAQELGALIGKIQRSADNVTQAAIQLTRSSTQIQASSSQQSEAATAMAASIEQTTAGIGQVAEFASQAQAICHESGALLDEGSDKVQQTVREMQQIAATVRDAANLIETLGQRSSEISAIIDVIKEIAEQTNLLALNAAIEAARAGEQGRGFAVVADEVRKLAERTTHSTQDISAMIEAIQQGIQQAVGSMQQGVGSVDQGVDLASHAGASMGKIKEGTARMVRFVNDISASLKEQSAASNAIAANIEQIARMADENSNDVARSTATARELEELAIHLQQEVRRYQVG
ncbi:methyl-accepting chemotaxis protein [Denitratisoma sp. agr-D3]